MGLVRAVLAAMIVAVVPAGAVLALYGLWRWAGRLARAGAIAVAGLVLTGAAVVNLGVARGCDDAGTRNRPAIAAVVEHGACQRAALAQVDLALLSGLVASLLGLVRPSATTPPGGAGGSTGARRRWSRPRSLRTRGS